MNTEESLLFKISSPADLRKLEPADLMRVSSELRQFIIDVVSNIILDEKGRAKYHFVIVNYLVKLRGGRLEASDDAEDLRWVPLDEVEEYDLTNSFREFFTHNRKMLKHVNSCL